MNIIYGLIGATVGRSSGTKEILIEDSIEVKGIFSRSKVQDKHFKEKGYQRFHTKLIRSADHGIVYYIRLSSKAKLVLSYNMDMYPKPYSWEVEKSCGIPENTLLITMKQSCGAHSDQCYLKFFDDKSFQRWQRQLGQILAEINCLYAMKPLQSGRLSANKMHQTILYCRMLLPLSEHEDPLIDGQFMLTLLNDRSPAVERIHLVHWVRRMLSDTIEGLLVRPCHVTAEDISLLHRCAETIRDFDEDPDMLYVVTRLEVRSHYTRHELERICKAIEYDEAAEEAEASRWRWGAATAEQGSSSSSSSNSTTFRSSRNSSYSSNSSSSGCSNNAEIEFVTAASAVVVYGSPSSPLSDESASLPIVDETPEPGSSTTLLSHRDVIVAMNMEVVRRATLGRRAVDRAVATRSFESLLIDSTKFHSPSVRIRGTRVSAKKVIATMLGSPTIIGRAPLQAILAGSPRKVVMPHRLYRSENLPKQQSDAMLWLKDAPSRVYARENNENDCTNASDHVRDNTSPTVSPELINIPEASAENLIAISSPSGSKHRDSYDAHRRRCIPSSTPITPSHHISRGCRRVVLLALLYSSVVITSLIVMVWFRSPTPTAITPRELKCGASLQPPVIGSEPSLVGLLSAAAGMDDDYSHTARAVSATTRGSTTSAAVSDGPRGPMLSIRDGHMTTVTPPTSNQKEDEDDLFNLMEAGRGITDTESILIRREVSTGTGAGAAVVGWIPRKDERSTFIHHRLFPSAVMVLFRVIRRVVGWLQIGLWAVGRRLHAMIYPLRVHEY